MENKPLIEKWLSLTEEINKREDVGGEETIKIEEERRGIKKKVEGAVRDELRDDLNDLLFEDVNIGVEFREPVSWLTVSPKYKIKVIRWKSLKRRMTEKEKLEMENSYSRNGWSAHVWDVRGLSTVFNLSILSLLFGRSILISDRISSWPYMEYVLGHEALHRYYGMEKKPIRKFYRSGDLMKIEESSCTVFGYNRALYYFQKRFGKDSIEFKNASEELSKEMNFENYITRLKEDVEKILKERGYREAEEYMARKEPEIKAVSPPYARRYKPNTAYLATQSCYFADVRIGDKLDCLFKKLGPKGFVETVGGITSVDDFFAMEC